MFNKLSLAILSVCSLNAIAYDDLVDITNCPTTAIVVGNVDDASGWGGHFSTAAYSDGYGGSYAECHLTGADSGPQTGNVTVLCYDGYTNPEDHVDMYRLDLGPRSQIEQVEFKVTERGVAVEAIRHSISGYTDDENPYVTTTFFPLGESAGFCRESSIYYQADGNLANRRGRSGSGYTMTAVTIE
jgi:hypothetical protein